MCLTHLLDKLYSVEVIMHELNLPSPQFYRVFSPKTSHKCSYSHPLHVHDPNHTHP